jgi:hypothetical protein
MSDLPKEKLIKKAMLIISIGLFVFSLSQECFCTSGECGGKGSGLAILLFGCLGFFLSPAGFTWLANPTIFFSWIYLNKNPRQSTIAGLVAVILSCSFLFFHKIVSDESGYPKEITGCRLGYWLWISSMIVMLIGNLTIYIVKKRNLEYNFKGHS